MRIAAFVSFAMILIFSPFIKADENIDKSVKEALKSRPPKIIEEILDSDGKVKSRKVDCGCSLTGICTCGDNCQCENCKVHNTKKRISDFELNMQVKNTLRMYAPSRASASVSFIPRKATYHSSATYIPATYAPVRYTPVRYTPATYIPTPATYGYNPYRGVSVSTPRVGVSVGFGGGGGCPT